MNQYLISVSAAFLLTYPSLGFGQESKVQSATEMQTSEPSKEDRLKMAAMHQQMSLCLKSDKTLEDCRKEMMANCPMMKDGHCSMMGDSMSMKHHGKMMHGQSGKNSKKTPTEKKQ